MYLPNRDGHSAWVNSKALEIGGITRDTPDPADGRIERDDARVSRPGTLHEGAMDLVGAPRARTRRPRSWYEGLLKGQAYLHSLGHHRVAGRDRRHDQLGRRPRRRTSTAAEARRPHGSGRRARCGGTAIAGLEQIEELEAQRARGRVGRFAATSVKIMQDGVCENFTAAVLDPYLDAHGHADREPGHLLRRARAAEGGRDAPRRRRVPGPLPRPRRTRGARGARRDRGGADGERAERRSAPPRAHPGRASRRHPAVPRARRGRERAAALGGARGADGRPDDPVPRASPGGAGSTRSRASCAPAPSSRWGATGASPAPNPLEEIHVAVNRKMPARLPRTRSRLARGLPARRAARPRRPRSAAFTMGSAYVNHLDDRHGLDRGRASTPTSR